MEGGLALSNFSCLICAWARVGYQATGNRASWQGLCKCSWFQLRALCSQRQACRWQSWHLLIKIKELTCFDRRRRASLFFQQQFPSFLWNGYRTSTLPAGRWIVICVQSSLSLWSCLKVPYVKRLSFLKIGGFTETPYWEISHKPPVI